MTILTKKKLTLLGIITIFRFILINTLPAEDGVDTKKLSPKPKHVKVLTFDFYAALSNLIPGLQK